MNKTDFKPSAWIVGEETQCGIGSYLRWASRQEPHSVGRPAEALYHESDINKLLEENTLLKDRISKSFSMESDLEQLQEAIRWLRAALDCPQFPWDQDQWDTADWACRGVASQIEDLLKDNHKT